MKCFYHNKVDAVGICKSCNKGICIECATDVSNGIACKDRCESNVIIINELTNKSKKAFKGTAILYVFLGVMFSALGVSNLKTGTGYFYILMGLLFLVVTFFSLSTDRKFTRTNSKSGKNKSLIV